MSEALLRFQCHVRADLFRYGGEIGLMGIFRAWNKEPGFRLVFSLRLCRLLREVSWTRWGIYHLIKYFYTRSCVRYGVYLDPFMELGGGLFIPHPCSIIVNSRVVIGSNCNLSQGVTIGVGNRGRYPGFPRICSRVFIGPGAVIFGGISVGEGAAIGANSVVTKPVPAGRTVAGVPAVVISDFGSDGYVNFTLDEPDE